MRSIIWISRLSVFRWLAALLCAALLWPAAQAQDAKTLRIGFQKYGTLCAPWATWTSAWRRRASR